MSGDWIRRTLDDLSKRGLMRSFRRVRTPQGPKIEIEGKEVVNFCGNDYLGLAADRRVIRAAQVAAARWGAGSGSSRLIAGNLGIFGELEAALAKLKGTEAALLFPSGYHANLGLITALAGKGDTVFSDRLNHASIIDGCRLSRAKIEIYEHSSAADLDDKLGQSKGAGEKLVVTESLFSMDGDFAPLTEILEVVKKHDAMLVIDDAHATGVAGVTGAGGLEKAGLDPSSVTAVMGTLGKALGSAGAFVCGTRVLIDLLINKARTFVFTTGPAPATAGAALEALRVMREEPGRKERVLAHAQTIRQALAQAGFNSPSQDGSPIVPVVLGSPDAAMNACEKLLERGLFVQGIRPPTVPEGTSRLRITFSAGHDDEQVRRLAEALLEILKA